MKFFSNLFCSQLMGPLAVVDTPSSYAGRDSGHSPGATSFELWAPSKPNPTGSRDPAGPSSQPVTRSPPPLTNSPLSRLTPDGGSMQQQSRLATWLGAALGAVSVLLFFAAAGHASDHQGKLTEEFHQVYPLSAEGRIDLENINGPVHITSWDRNEVKGRRRQARLEQRAPRRGEDRHQLAPRFSFHPNRIPWPRQHLLE